MLGSQIVYSKNELRRGSCNVVEINYSDEEKSKSGGDNVGNNPISLNKIGGGSNSQIRN